MAAGFHAHNAVRPAAPETPKKRDETGAINDLVRELRDELGLAIAPRDFIYSPSQCNNSSGDALYNRIKILWWQEREALLAIIEECKADFAGDLDTLSAQRRTEFVFQRLNDAAWFATNRTPRQLRNAKSPLFTRTPSSLQAKYDSTRRVHNTIHADLRDVPMSPLARKSTAGSEDTISTNTLESSQSRSSLPSNDVTANTSFSTDVPGSMGDEKLFGSSWTPSQISHLEELHDTRPDPHASKSIPSAPATGLERQSMKRSRSDDFVDVPGKLGKKLKQYAQDWATPDKKQSPQKSVNWQHQVAALARCDTGLEHPFEFDDTLPYAILVERARLMRYTGQTYEQVSTIVNHDSAKKVTATKSGEPPYLHSSPTIWTLPVTRHVSAEDPRLSLSARVDLSSNRGDTDLFQLTIQPIRRQSRSNQLERHFGWDRILSITFPSLTRGLPSHLKGQEDAIVSAFHDWLVKPKRLLGRTWRVFHLAKITKKIAGKRAFDPTKTHEVLFFATSGDGISSPISYYNFLDWMTPFKENARQPVCKLFARHDLYISRTTPTVHFRYSQIRFVGDILANGEYESDDFDDPALLGQRRKQFGENEVMTDGCARISFGAAEEVCEILGITERPTTFQARINGHKGIWHIDAPYRAQHPADRDIWIEIRPSQAKVKIRPEDRDESQCESDRWCFNVVEHTRPPKCSEVHRDFFQLLEDRHVPREKLLAVADARTHKRLEEWKTAMDDPAEFALLREELDGGFEDKRTTYEQGLPRTASAKTRLFMDEAGYSCKECLVLADAVSLMQDRDLQQLRKQLKFPCARSTFVVGIADPKGVLAPGEVQLRLSQPIVDKATDGIFDPNDGSELLITRHPTLLNSDMQKVKNRHPEALAHLKDVVVMSTRGRVPLAAKLQGGDYDGDKFWVCADEGLVRPFLNAPVMEQVGIDQLGIKQETRLLGDIVSKDQLYTDEHAEAWMRIVLPFALRGNQLGTVTTYLYDLAYHRNSLSDPGVKLIADVHDLIIDTEKNGYVFEAEDFALFREKHSRFFPSVMGKPAWHMNTNHTECSLDDQSGPKVRLLDMVCKTTKKKPENILDDLVFNVLNPKMRAHLEKFQKCQIDPSNSIDDDEDLQFVLDQIPVALAELERKNFVAELDKTLGSYHKWTVMWQKKNGRELRAKAFRECVDMYNAIRPSDPNQIFWTTRHGPNGPTTWDCFKVGVLASRAYKYKRKYMFWVARDTVCYLKALSISGKRNVDRIKAVKKPKRPKDWAELDANDDAAQHDCRDGVGDDEPDHEDFDIGYDEEAFNALH